MRWFLAYGLLILVMILAFVYLYQEASKVPAWDGTFECRSGETYTTKECS